MEKWCPGCKATKPAEAFGKDASTKTGLRSACRQCSIAIRRANYLSHRQARIASTQKWKHHNPGRAEAQARRQHWGYKKRAVEGYGGKCQCCGEANIQFLVIDHPNQNGGAERKLGIFGKRIYRKVIEEGFPVSYRVLCANCNMATTHERACPHAALALAKAESTPMHGEQP